MEVKPGSCIYVLDDVISDELCETLKIIIDNTKGTGKNEYSEKNNVKCKSVSLNHFENKEFAYIIDNKVKNVVGDIIRRMYILRTNLNPINGDSGYDYRKIHGATRIHTDSIFPGILTEKIVPVSQLRKLSLIIALNGDYEGGEFYFPDQDVKIKLKKGQAITFPPYWTHEHGTGELLNNTFRYTISTWLLE